MFKTARIRVLTAAMLLLAACSVGYMIYSTFQLDKDRAQLSEAWTERYNSYLLADELRQSSDDLTRLGACFRSDRRSGL